MNKYTSNNIKSIKTINPYFLINWHCTGWCNYHCPYCINAKWKGAWIDESRKIEEAKKINELILKNNIKLQISFRLIGGEPGFYNWPKILDYIERIDKIIFVSNLSNSLDYYKQLYLYCKKRNIKTFIGLSKHEENKDFDKKAIELTKWCIESKMSEPQIVLVADNNFDEEYVKYLHENGITRIRISLLRDQEQSNEISNKVQDLVYKYNKQYEMNRKYRQFEITFMDDTKERFCNSSDITNLMGDGGFNPDGFYCSAGPTTLAILPNSDVVRNKCDFLKDDVLGNLLTDEIKIPTEPVLCSINKKFGTTTRRCSICSGTDFIRKE